SVTRHSACCGARHQPSRKSTTESLTSIFLRMPKEYLHESEIHSEVRYRFFIVGKRPCVRRRPRLGIQIFEPLSSDSESTRLSPSVGCRSCSASEWHRSGHARRCCSIDVGKQSQYQRGPAATADHAIFDRHLFSPVRPDDPYQRAGPTQYNSEHFAAQRRNISC